MTITAHLEALRAALAAWAADNGAALAVAANRNDLVSLVKQDPTGLKVVLTFAGETMNEADAQHCVVWRTFAATLIRPNGWTAVRAENLTTGTASGAALYDLVDSLRNAVINSHVGPQLELWPRYTAASEVDLGEVNRDAWQVEFTAGAFLTDLNAAPEA